MWCICGFDLLYYFIYCICVDMLRFNICAYESHMLQYNCCLEMFLKPNPGQRAIRQQCIYSTIHAWWGFWVLENM